MVAEIQGETNSKNGLLTFEITKPIELETIVSSSDMAQTRINYMAGSKVEGFPIIANLIDLQTKLPIQTGSKAEGILVEKDSGHVIIPFNYVKEVTIVETVKDAASELIEEGKGFLPDGGVLGFTYKQILFLGLFTIIVTKLVKK